MPLSTAEREAFLTEPHIAALAIASGNDRAPLTVPIWYQYEPGGDIWFTTDAASRKAAAIKAAGRVSLMVQRVSPSVRYVSVEGPVIKTEAGTEERMREIVARYLPAERMDEYLAFAASNHSDQLVVHVRPEHWLSADLGWA